MYDIWPAQIINDLVDFQFKKDFFFLLSASELITKKSSLKVQKMIRKFGSILTVTGLNQTIKRGLSVKNNDKPPKILITGMLYL